MKQIDAFISILKFDMHFIDIRFLIVNKEKIVWLVLKQTFHYNLRDGFTFPRSASSKGYLITDQNIIVEISVGLQIQLFEVVTL